MSIAWLLPGALIGIGLIALPIAIHMLVRQHVRTLPYPSLRFLKETQLAAFRRRSIQDAALLACRAAIIALAAMALAGPVLQTAARQDAYASRISRAIVIAPDGAERGTIDKTEEGAFASALFARRRLADALADAIRWFDAQPASAREIVFVGTLRRGDLTDVEVAAVPPGIGVRFVPESSTRAPITTIPVLTRRDGRLVAIHRPVRLDSDSTFVSDAAVTSVRQDLVEIAATPQNASLADAALRAALNAGVPWSNFNQRVIVVWDDAPAGAESTERVIVRMPVPSPPSTAADAVREALAMVSPPSMRDPVLINADRLASWTRAPGPPSPDAPVVDEGDRRWLWGVVLVLLAVEAWLRRSARSDVSQATTAEVRVA